MLRRTLVAFLLPLFLAAHADLALQLADVTRRIQQEPANATLYLGRGELHRAIGNWEMAMADYDRAERVDPRLAAVDLARGRTLLAAGRLEPALARLDRFVARQPGHGEGRILRARVLVKLDRRGEAAEEYTRGIARLPRPQPEHYLERAQTLAASGRLDDALRGIDEGLTKLGPLATLELYAIDLELRQRRYDAALSRLDRVAARSPRKDTWLARRGEILEQAGRPADARAAYRSALAAIDALPPSRRNVPSTVDLEKRVRAALKRGHTG